jgi:fructokinase
MASECIGPSVIGLGEILWDVLPTGRRLGGAPANFAYHARLLGAEAAVASSVGRDELGGELLQELDRLGLRRNLVSIDATRPTGLVTVAIGPRGEPDYIIHENVAWDYIPLTAGLLETAARAKAICFGSLAQRSAVSRETILHALSVTSADCLRIFDINLRQHYHSAAIIAAGLRAANVLKLNDAELPVVAELLGLRGTTDDMLAALVADFSLRAVALTCGADGAVLVTPERRSRQRGIAATVVDTVGAGDSFTAMLAIGLLRHWDLEEINRRACRLASYVCTQRGATPAVPPELLEA